MGPLNGQDAGLMARGSWLLEPDTRSGMLLYPRDWSFSERRDVFAHLAANGWEVLPATMFRHLSSDGETVIRLLQNSDSAAPGINLGRLYEFRRPAVDLQPIEASL
jgi:hypothetical protein